MSRSSKGFADFFPTAPSVIQQKKSKIAQEKNRQDSSSSRPPPSTAHTRVSSDNVLLNARKNDGAHRSSTNGVNHDRSLHEATTLTQDESESVQGDLLNGVGSASSTSTASSVFDAHNRQHDLSQQNRSDKTELTPLTTIDSSSPGQNKSPAYRKQDSSAALHPGTSSRAAPSTMSRPPSSIPKQPDFSGMCGVRPGKGKSKGAKIIYDPELDKTISSKERRSRPPQYKDIVSDVS